MGNRETRGACEAWASGCKGPVGKLETGMICRGGGEVATKGEGGLV